MYFAGRVAAIVALLIGFPVHLIIALLIWVLDGRPVFFTAMRLGNHSTKFGMLKYRSMRVGCQPIVSADLKVLVTDSDPRVTVVGHVLRCGIDELPQLINVAKGEMAWIGPRPDEIWMLPKYGVTIRGRLDSKPGISGLGQVCGSRVLSTAEGYALDIWYVRHQSFFLDVLIALLTPLHVLGYRRFGTAVYGRIEKTREFNDILAGCQRELDSVTYAGPPLGVSSEIVI